MNFIKIQIIVLGFAQKSVKENSFLGQMNALKIAQKVVLINMNIIIYAILNAQKIQ